jgi:hypothetical protein
MNLLNIKEKGVRLMNRIGTIMPTWELYMPKDFVMKSLRLSITGLMLPSVKKIERMMTQNSILKSFKVSKLKPGFY